MKSKVLNDFINYIVKSRNTGFCSRKSGEEVGTHDVSYQGGWVEKLVGVDTMEDTMSLQEFLC